MTKDAEKILQELRVCLSELDGKADEVMSLSNGLEDEWAGALSPDLYSSLVDMAEMIQEVVTEFQIRKKYIGG